MTNLSKYYLALVFLLVCCPLSSRSVYDPEHRFVISFPDDEVAIERYTESLTPYLTADYPGYLVQLSIYPVEGKKGYSYKKSILKNPAFNWNSDYYYLQPEEPWYNLLRHKRVSIEGPEEGAYYLQRIEYRAKTLFVLQIICQEESLEKARAILSSFDSRCNVRSFYLIMRYNLTWLMGSLYISLIPLLGYFSGHYRDKWKRSGKKDKVAKLLNALCLLSTIVLLLLMTFCLKDCLALAGIIGVVSALVWGLFYYRNSFFMSFFKGIFG